MSIEQGCAAYDCLRSERGLLLRLAGYHADWFMRPRPGAYSKCQQNGQ